MTARPLVTWVWVAVAVMALILMLGRWDGNGAAYVPDRPMPAGDVWCSGPGGCAGVNGG